jgi:hypothetical protein
MNGSDLARLSEAAIMLAEARTLPDIRKVHNLAQRAQDYAKAARLGLDAQNSAAAIRLEAEAKAGELLRQMRETGERARRGLDLQPANQESQPATLADLGVTPDESSRWQQVAQIPADERRAYVEAAQQRETEVTRAGLLRFAHPAPSPRIEDMQPPEPARGRIAMAHLLEHLQQARIDVDTAGDLLSEDTRAQVADHIEYIRWRARLSGAPLREVI